MRKYLTYLFLSMFAVLGALSNTANAADKPYPMDYWAVQNAVENAQVSPDGKHFFWFRRKSKTGAPYLEVYKTDDLSKPLLVANAKPMEFYPYSGEWLDDERITGVAWKVIRKSVKGPEEDVRGYKIFSYNIKTKKFSRGSDTGSYNIVSKLPSEPDYVLVETSTANLPGITQSDPFARFRPRSYYKLNLKTGRKSLVLKGSDKYPFAQFDDKGNPRFRQWVDQDKKEFIVEYRRVGETKWNEFGRKSGKDHDLWIYQFDYIADKPGDPNTVIVLTNDQDDKSSLYEFNLTTGKLGKKIYGNPNADVVGVLHDSMEWDGEDNIVAAIYPGAKFERHWFDMKEKALYDQFENAIPNAHQIRITSRSRDGKTMIVHNHGPHDPGTFYLVKDGKMGKLASQNPLVDPAKLADVKFITFKARDGLDVHAYVTIPKTGKAPYPLVVLPHGGPYVNEVVTYDEWAQMLADNGYMVVQPEYRGSTGWGKKFFLASYNQHGKKMQDDKDDAALYLVKQGLADKNRMAMFGWSYGGYAALVAASRDPQIYQCTIAGAAVADPKKVYLKRKSSREMPASDDWARQRGGFSGVNPIEEVDKINIPLLMIHGDVDRRVLYFNYKDYKKKVEQVAKSRAGGKCSGGLGDSECIWTLYRSSSNKEGESGAYVGKAKFLTLKGADHFYVTHFYEHNSKFYPALLDFLKNDCGPGGL